MTGLKRLRKYADSSADSVSGGCKEGQSLNKGFCPAYECSKCRSLVIHNIADQIEHEQAEDRKIAEWVREHGGIDELKKMEKLALKGEVESSAVKTLRELAGVSKNDTASIHSMREELDNRLMPPGYEWPRFEDGKKVCAGDKFAERIYGNESVAMCIGFNKNAAYILGDDNEDWVADYGTHNRVKRPKPAPIGADGLPIHEGEHVWDVNDGRYEMVVSRTELDELDHVGVTQEEPTPANVSIHPSRLTHTKPVIGADGLAIHSGDTMWGIERGDEYVVEFIITDGSHREYNVRAYCVYGEEIVYLRPDKLTHTKPTIGADGLPVYHGERVWCINVNGGFSHGPYVVDKTDESTVLFTDGHGTGLSNVTHTNPEQPDRRFKALDTWDKYEEKLCYLLDDGDLASELTDRAKAIAEQWSRSNED